MRYLTIILMLVLTGCAQLDVAQSAVSAYGARAADEARASAEWTLCQSIMVGAWRRAYGADPLRAQGWTLLCAPPASLPLPALPRQQRSAPPPTGPATWMT